MVELSALRPGDQVKVVDQKVAESYVVDGPMTALLGKVVTIRGIALSRGSRGVATIEEDGGRFHWGAAAFEYIVEDDMEPPPLEEFLSAIRSFGY